MPPKGAWNPSMNISQVLQQIRMLLQEPNPDDPLMPEITNMYVSSRSRFDVQAKTWTERYAVESEKTTVSDVAHQGEANRNGLVRGRNELRHLQQMRHRKSMCCSDGYDMRQVITCFYTKGMQNLHAIRRPNHRRNTFRNNAVHWRSCTL